MGVMTDKKFPRFTMGHPIVDGWVDDVATTLERCLNVTGTGGIQAHVGPTGINLAFAAKHWQWAKSSSSGIAAMTGATPGKATDVVLYDFDGTTLTSQGVVETAYNMGSEAVGASKWLLIAKIDKYWFVLWEDCPES